MVDVPNQTSRPPLAAQSWHRPARIRPPSLRLGYARTTPDQHDLRQAVLELHQLGVPSELVFIDRGSTAPGTNRLEKQRSEPPTAVMCWLSPAWPEWPAATTT